MSVPHDNLMGGGVRTVKCNHEGVKTCRLNASEKKVKTSSRGRGKNFMADNRKPRPVDDGLIETESCGKVGDSIAKSTVI